MVEKTFTEKEVVLPSIPPVPSAREVFRSSLNLVAAVLKESDEESFDGAGKAGPSTPQKVCALLMLEYKRRDERMSERYMVSIDIGRSDEVGPLEPLIIIKGKFLVGKGEIEGIYLPPRVEDEDDAT